MVEGNLTINSTLVLANVSTNIQTSIEVDDYACLRSPYYRFTLIVMFAIVIVMSAIENILLWIVFITKKKLRTVAIGYLISLSGSDFVTAASLAWLELYYVYDYPSWILGSLGSDFVNAFWCFSLVNPFTHIVFITVDRYRAVTSAILYSQCKSWSREIVKIGFIWVYSIGIVLLFAFYFYPASNDYYEWNVSPEWYYPFIAIHIVIPLLIGTTMYIKMMAHVRQHRKETKNLKTANSALREFKFARAVAIIIGALYAVWIPVIILECIYALYAHTCLIAQLGTISVWLTCTSGVINPIIFLSRNAPYRQAVCCLRLGRLPVLNRFMSTQTTTARSTNKRTQKGFVSSTYSKPSTRESNFSRYSIDEDASTVNKDETKPSVEPVHTNGDLNRAETIETGKEIGVTNSEMTPVNKANLIRMASISEVDIGLNDLDIALAEQEELTVPIETPESTKTLPPVDVGLENPAFSSCNP